MKKLFAIAVSLMAFSANALSAVPSYGAPAKAALEFNQWYLGHFKNIDSHPVGKEMRKYIPIDGKEIEKYVTVDTLKKVRNRDAQTRLLVEKTGADFTYGDEDFFTKTEDIISDWPTNINVISADYDPVCATVYIALGKEQDYVVADCMVQEEGIWKVQSVAAFVNRNAFDDPHP
ncbi:hypothetical protein [Atlantibacter sp. RC6]|uniref:hypothetical protein n=1 Tax=Atlantibacter sp. RC6 TaxID=2587036 RepID=UPI001606E4E3|nr:hypothetical protein [Atlantibacter sp. RC6]MBB3322741.1 hypothetical protein [Atlantibacter sp. RC6]